MSNLLKFLIEEVKPLKNFMNPSAEPIDCHKNSCPGCVGFILKNTHKFTNIIILS